MLTNFSDLATGKEGFLTGNPLVLFDLDEENLTSQGEGILVVFLNHCS